MTRALFVTWDGPQVHYLESLFVPIFVGLREYGIAVDVLQFGWGNQEDARTACERAGIGYRRVEIMRGLGRLGPLRSAITGGRHVSAAIEHFGSTVINPRSLFAGLAALMSGRRDLPFLFDSDGLLSEERREEGGGRGSPAYLALRLIERSLLRRADRILVRTKAAATLLARRGKRAADVFTIVRNGRDEREFRLRSAAEREEVLRRLGLAGRSPVIVYAGSVGPQYQPDKIGELFERIREDFPSSALLFLTPEIERARLSLGRAGSQAKIVSVPPSEVPSILAACDIGVSLRRQSLAMTGVAPIKLGEYLLTGLPVIGTPRIGNTRVAEENGVFIDVGLERAEISKWVVHVLERRIHYRARAREIGIRHFSLSGAVADYAEAVATLRKRSIKRGAQVASE